MKINNIKFPAYLMIILLAGLGRNCFAETQPVLKAGESEVKAAFIYNFLKFTDWPRDKVSQPNTITIGILGEHDFKNAFDAVKDKKINDNKIMVKTFGKFSRFTAPGKENLKNEIEELKKCHLLFVCDSEQKSYKEIFEILDNSHILTVGETEDFLEAGGIITFTQESEKMRFEINQTACKNAEVKISSQVLRLARKVIGTAE